MLRGLPGCLRSEELARGVKRQRAQRSQYPLIKEYTLNCNRIPKKFKVCSLIKGYWVLWGDAGV